MFQKLTSIVIFSPSMIPNRTGVTQFKSLDVISAFHPETFYSVKCLFIKLSGSSKHTYAGSNTGFLQTKEINKSVKSLRIGVFTQLLYMHQTRHQSLE